MPAGKVNEATAEEKLTRIKEKRRVALRKAMKKINKYHHRCLRCGNDWHGRTPSPRFCPSCSSPYWARKPTRPNAKATGTKANPHTTITLKVPWVYGLKKAASQAEMPAERSVSAYVLHLFDKAGIQPLSAEEYREWKEKRKSAGRFYLD